METQAIRALSQYFRTPRNKKKFAMGFLFHLEFHNITIDLKTLIQKLADEKQLVEPNIDNDGIGCRKKENIEKFYDTTAGSTFYLLTTKN